MGRMSKLSVVLDVDKLIKLLNEKRFASTIALISCPEYKILIVNKLIKWQQNVLRQLRAGYVDCIISINTLVEYTYYHACALTYAPLKRSLRHTQNTTTLNTHHTKPIRVTEVKLSSTVNATITLIYSVLQYTKMMFSNLLRLEYLLRV